MWRDAHNFYRQLCHALGLTPASTADSLFYALSRHVEDSAAERVHPVFLLDESHLLHQDTLDHLHILLNYAWDSRALLSLVLVGLPELRERLALRYAQTACRAQRDTQASGSRSRRRLAG
jgi:type II secretory pathway predicted ATPase ExeA